MRLVEGAVVSHTRVTFTADITVEDRDISLAGGVEQAVQNEIGPSGAQVIKVTEVAAFPTIRCPKCGATSPCENYGPGCP